MNAPEFPCTCSSVVALYGGEKCLGCRANVVIRNVIIEERRRCVERVKALRESSTCKHTKRACTVIIERILVEG